MRQCTECKADFKPKKPHQVTCLSAECKRSRNYKKIKEKREKLKPPQKKQAYASTEICNRFLLRGLK